MALLDKYSKIPSKFSAIGVVDFFKSTFVSGFTKKINSTQINPKVQSKFSRTDTTKYDPTK